MTPRPSIVESTHGEIERPSTTRLELYSTCPSSKGASPGSYLRDVVDVARWSEEAGCRGLLVYTDNGLVDPWLVSQVVLQNTQRIRPLVAVQPAYTHPYTVAKKIATLAFLHGRAVDLNMVAGGFKNDLEALDDRTPHDERYDRLVEYTRIVTGLLDEPRGVSQEGRYYTVRNLKLVPPLPTGLRPRVMISGSSPAGLAAAEATGSMAVKYPQPASEETGPDADSGIEVGVRVGIVARDTDAEAWAVAEERFPPDRQGQLTQQLATKVSDSHWHRKLAAQDERPGGVESPYWMRPFHNYKTFCPYLVGSYERVADEISAYVARGNGCFILDIPPTRVELEHTRHVFDLVAHLQTA